MHLPTSGLLRRSATAASLLVLPFIAKAQLPSPTYGWNLGNTMEATTGVGTWSPAPTQALIDSIHAAGFNTIRIPCAWSINSNQSTNQIDATYMAQVTEVVQWALNDGMAVVINDHYDGGWFERQDFTTYNSSTNSRLVSLWTQIANNFKGYSSKLLFACANEPSVSSAAETQNLFKYYQSFVNAVRATGGNNSTRLLILQGPGGSNIDDTNSWVTALPTDPAGAGHLAMEVHFYSPYQYCLMKADASWGSQWYFWGSGYDSTVLPSRNATAQTEAYVQSQFQSMQTQFTSKGIPVLVGEFGSMNRTGDSALSGNELKRHQASRTYFDEVVVSTANSMGLRPVYWDDGGTNMNSFGIIDRSSASITDTNSVRALTGGAAQPAPGAASITLSSTSMSFGTSAGSKSATVVSNTSWTVTDNQSWISVSPTSGTDSADITISVTQNTGSARSGTVTVSGGGVTRTMSVSQASGAPITIQAESGIAAGGVTFDSNNTGFNGSGFANFPTSGGTLTFNNVTGNGGGTKALSIRYANGATTTRSGTITVNGVTSNISFNPTGSWTTWTTHTVNITLNNSTTNTIKLASTGQDFGNIDQITIP